MNSLKAERAVINSVVKQVDSVIKNDAPASAEQERSPAGSMTSTPTSVTYASAPRLAPSTPPHSAYTQSSSIPIRMPTYTQPSSPPPTSLSKYFASRLQTCKTCRTCRDSRNAWEQLPP